MSDALQAKRSAFEELARARLAWQAAHDLAKPLPENPLPALVPHRERWIFSRARRALWAGAWLEPDEHAELLCEVARHPDQVPPDVTRYLSQRPGRGRPRRPTTAEREREAIHACWLLWGYYRRIGRPQPRESAWDVAALAVGKSAGAIEALKKKHSLRPW